MVSDEMVEKALRIAQGARPVGAGDGDTYVVSPPTMATMRAAINAIAPSIRAEGYKAGLEETANVAGGLSGSFAEEANTERRRGNANGALRARHMMDGAAKVESAIRAMAERKPT